ncbi:AI-2E family transporter [Flavipsychrobacter stenotrophus]|uniref:AI-2E family transporter n=1 Tax=Flavipsychrobacter stenotrophus TaxID=2077091 RepID=A0A2S7SU05_9BACT|nr:AI-2E family transporter [Flavipsychrobacter stenotrophus]PQJ10075.1 AI-2E family transporter [Flavipsychrobacter stenotrophus]
MKDMPLTVRRSIELLGLCAVGGLLVSGKDVIMPLITAFFFALLMLPMLRRLIKHKIPEALSIVLCIVAVFIVVAGIATFLSYQVGGLVSDIDKIKENLLIHWNNISKWISTKTHLSVDQQMTMIHKQATKAGNNATGYVQGVFSSLSNILIFVGLLPIYIFLILFYRKSLLQFTYMWFDKTNHPKVTEAVKETEVIIKYYLGGLLIQISYLTVLLGGILLLFGIKHAILIGVIFAILNLIPYIGALIGNLIGVILTLTSSQEMWQIWAVLGSIAVVQFLDNNILMPRIVGSKVKINALASIVSIVIGGQLAGVAGMFLSIPVMAVLKIIFDKSTHLRQWGLLLGDDTPDNPNISKLVQRLQKKRDEEITEKEK